jgi:hypothetical protein
VFERSVKIFETDAFVKDPVVAFIAFDVIVLEFDIDDDVILFVCKLPLDMILPFIVWFPEHIRLFAVVKLLIFDYIIIIDYIFIK